MTYSEADDRALVHAFRNGDEKAFEEIVRRYQRQVANLLYLATGNRQDVEDLSQEVFVRVYRSLGGVSVRDSLFSWIYRIALNLAVDESRRKKIRRFLSLDVLAQSPSAEEVLKDPSSASDSLMAGERREQVLKALQILPPKHRAALVLREYEDLSYKEIAETLGITEQAVKSRIFRAREELKKYLSDYFKERQ